MDPNNAVTGIAALKWPTALPFRIGKVGSDGRVWPQTE